MLPHSVSGDLSNCGTVAWPGKHSSIPKMVFLEIFILRTGCVKNIKQTNQQTKLLFNKGTGVLPFLGSLSNVLAKHLNTSANGEP